MKNVSNHLLALASMAFVSLSFAATPRVSIFEDFRGNPLTNGWKVFGQTNLFAWNVTNQNLEVTWDSSKPNSYFYKPLGGVLGRPDNFSLYFDLRLNDIAIGTTSNKPYTFQVAVGLLNFGQATNSGFLRGTGFNSPNLFEFDYFPDSGFGATISPTIISSNNEFSATFILEEVNTNDLFRIIMANDEDDDQVRLTVLRNGMFYAGEAFGYPSNFTGFSVDTVAIASYSDEGQSPPEFSGSILAHGTIDNLAMTTTGAVQLDLGFTGRFENGNWRMDFDTLPGWTFYAYRTQDFINRFLVGTYAGTNYGRGTIVHSNPPPSKVFYQLIAERP